MCNRFQAFDLLTSGFTGILKNWWENYIQEDGCNKIRTHMNSQGQPDNIDTLIYTIVTNFLESPKDIKCCNRYSFNKFKMSNPRRL